MDFFDILNRAFASGYASGQISALTVLTCSVCTGIIALYIFMVYKYIRRNSFYNRNFNISMMAIAIITAAIILTIQSNVVVSFGMVGALSIVRFRSAIKDPLDLVFLFWSISTGIICGAGFAMVAVITSLIITIIVLLISLKPEIKDTLLLVINSNGYKSEESIEKIIKSNCDFSHVRARNITKSSLNMVIEIKTKNRGKLIEELMALEEIGNVSLVDHEGDATV